MSAGGWGGKNTLNACLSGAACTRGGDGEGELSGGRSAVEWHATIAAVSFDMALGLYHDESTFQEGGICKPLG